jgi:hypothetical protein
MPYTSDIVEQFWDGLMKHLSEDDTKELSHATGAAANQIDQLKERFPSAPTALIRLLERVNGTYWQQYGDREIAVLILGSDVFEYPYYLKSVEQILTDNPYTQSIRQIYAKYFDEWPELVGKGIDRGTAGQIVRFLHDPDSFRVIADSFENYLQKLIDENFSFLAQEE